MLLDYVALAAQHSDTRGHPTNVVCSIQCVLVADTNGPTHNVANSHRCRVQEIYSMSFFFLFHR